MKNNKEIKSPQHTGSINQNTKFNMDTRLSRRSFVGSSAAMATAGLLGGGLASGLASASTIPTSGIISVRSFDVVGDGVTDDTVNLQRALNALDTGVTLLLEGLTLMISSTLEIPGKSGFVIDGQGATIIAEDGMLVEPNSNLLFIHECTDFTVRNLTVDGNRSTRIPAEVWAHNIAIHSCMRFIFEQVSSKNAVVDGFCFSLMNPQNYNDTSTYNRDFIILNCFADNCYRQGASVINAYDFLFIGGAYTNTNGTAPQAGIDVEANSGPTLGNARGRFYGCRFEGNAGYGLILSGVGGARSFSVESCNFYSNGRGGLGVEADDSHIRNCEFNQHNGAEIPQGVVAFQGNENIVSGSISNCRFTDNATTKHAIYLHPFTSGIKVSNNRISNHSGPGIFMFGTRHIVDKNSITQCSGAGIEANCADSVISENYIKNTTERGIYGGPGERLRVIRNTVEDITNVAGGYIQCVGIDCEIEGNSCISTSPTSDYGIWIKTSALAVHGNICVNLNPSDPYYFYSFEGDANNQLFYNNIGGTENDRRTVRKGMAIPAFSNNQRPDASSMAIGQSIFNTTTGQPNWSDGSNWVDSAGNII